VNTLRFPAPQTLLGLRRRLAAAALTLAVALGASGSSLAVQPADARPTPTFDDTGFPLRFGRFGSVQVRRPAQAPTSFTILVSGEANRDAIEVDLTGALAAHGSAVVTIDGPRYLDTLNKPGAGCQYLGGDFEGLSHEVQRRLGLESYLLPVLAGYSSGASLATVVLEQSPKGTYAGLLTIDFRPDLDLRRTPCRGNALAWQPRAGAGARQGTSPGIALLPAVKGSTPWLRLSRDGDWLVAAIDAQRTLAQRGLARPPTLPDLHDLPLHEVPATDGANAAVSDWYAVLLTGDGGWAGLDQDVSEALAAAGIPVVALNSLKYFWKARDPDAAALDLQRIVSRYRQRWHRDHVLLIGYSFGADVLPFLYRRLSPALRGIVGSVNLLAPAPTADFEFHLSDWLPGTGDRGRETVPEIERMGDARVLCLYGIDDGDSPCNTARLAGLQTVALAGGHHFDGDFAGIAARILRFAAAPGGAVAPAPGAQ